MTMLEALKKIKEAPNVYLGICSNLGYLDVIPDISKYYYSWPHYSGNHNYPVPDPKPKELPSYVNPSVDPIKFNAQARYYGNKWEGAYGNLRKDLLNHIIKCVEAEEQAQ